MRGARRYSKKVEFWSSTPSPDGFGGNTLAETLSKSLWADIYSLDAQKSTLNGIERGVQAYELFVRKDPDVNWADETLFVKLDGTSYRILRVEDMDFKGIEVKLTIST